MPSERGGGGSVGYAARLNQDADVGGTLGEPEIVDDDDIIERGALHLAELLRAASAATTTDGSRSSCVVHTGAGISRAAGIPDFRGPNGVWTRKARGLSPPPCETSLDRAAPTATHQCIAALARAGYVRCVVSCNVDCLHLKSGLPRNKLCELHGNCFAERCEDCRAEFVRDFEMRTVGFKLTGRRCVRCGGRLRDQVLDWDDALPEKELKQAERESASAALSLVLGSSLQIHPSCDIPLKTTRKRRMAKDPEADRVQDAPGKLVIVNLQPTKKDKKAHMVVHAPCDRVMRLVAKHLGLTLEPYVRKDRVMVAHECRASTSGSGYVFTVRIFNAHDENAPVPWIEKLDVAFAEREDIEGATLRKHPLRLKRACSEDDGKILVWLSFHFASGCTEPPVRVQYEVSYESERAVAREFEFVTMRKSFANE